MTKPFISIIVPIYNKSEYIKQCLDSLLRQSYPNIEILCVDDKSSDGSPLIVEKYKNNDNRIRFIQHKVNSGTMKARSTGVKAATGSYILFLDADDELEHDACDILYNVVKKHKACMYAFGTKVINPDKKIAMKMQANFKTYDGYLYGKDILNKSFIDRETTRYLWDKMYESSLCKQVYEEISDYHIDRKVNPVTEDIYTFMITAYFAKSFFGIQKTIHKYYYGRGVMGYEHLSLERFERYCMSAVDVENSSRMFSKFGVLDQYCDIIEAFRISSIKLCSSAWIYQIEEREKDEAFKIMMKYWSSSDLAKEFAIITSQLVNKKWETPFSLLPKGGRIVLYGAGEMGKDYYRQITDTGFCEIVLWVDNDYLSFNDTGLFIRSPDDINNEIFDYVLIAILDNRVASEIKQLLINSYGVPENKLVWQNRFVLP